MDGSHEDDDDAAADDPEHRGNSLPSVLDWDSERRRFTVLPSHPSSSSSSSSSLESWWPWWKTSSSRGPGQTIRTSSPDRKGYLHRKLFPADVLWKGEKKEGMEGPGDGGDGRGMGRSPLRSLLLLNRTDPSRESGFHFPEKEGSGLSLQQVKLFGVGFSPTLPLGSRTKLRCLDSELQLVYEKQRRGTEEEATDVSKANHGRIHGNTVGEDFGRVRIIIIMLG